MKYHAGKPRGEGGPEPLGTEYLIPGLGGDRTRRSGFSLIEMLCVMALLLVIMTISTLLIRATLRIEQVQTAGFDRLLHEKALAEQFRADVAAAEAAPVAWENHIADKSCLILRMKAGERIVYLWRDKALHRQVYADDKSTQTRLPVGADVDLEFVPAAAIGQLIRMHLYALRQGRRADGQTLEIAAALGGDWR